MYTLKSKGHTYLYQVDYGEENAVARIIVRADAAGTEGLFLVKPDGSLEPADDRDGFGANALRHDTGRGRNRPARQFATPVPSPNRSHMPLEPRSRLRPLRHRPGNR